MNIQRMNRVLSWLSIFIMSWMWILGVLKVNYKTIGFYIFFYIVAFVAATLEQSEEKKK